MTDRMSEKQSQMPELHGFCSESPTGSNPADAILKIDSSQLMFFFSGHYSPTEMIMGELGEDLLDAGLVDERLERPT